MKTNIIITDNFYSNPDSVREFALQQEFSVQGNFPGLRTKSILNQDVKDTIQSIVWAAGGQITEWNEQDGLTGSFEMATSANRSWIHTDHFNTWAGVLYLTPNAPVSGGTGLYRYRENGAHTAEELTDPYDAQDMTKWELCDMIGNRYNRLAMYRSNMFHTSMDYFGNTPQTGRLFQLFFFNTQF